MNVSGSQNGAAPPQFANVSAISGLDWADDGRGVAVTDWDFDGDVDFWVVNRSGPQVRFLRNSGSVRRAFVALRLRGTKSNRDAVGARVTLRTVDDPPQVKTIRAGDGYLSQSSKWLHFGLGDVRDVVDVDVRWPSGLHQRFTSLQPNRHYILTEGANEFALFEASRRRLAGVAASPLHQEDVNTSFRTVLTPRLIDTQLGSDASPDALTAVVGEASGRPVLVNLWGSSCAPCVEELQAFADHARQLTAAVNIVAVNVDTFSENESGDWKKLEEAWAELGSPVQFETASPQLADKLQQLANRVYDLHAPLGIPTSFLFDQQRRLAVIYRGPVQVDQLLTDVAELSVSEQRRRASGLPFAGRWSAEVRPHEAIVLALDLLRRGRLQQLQQTIDTHRAELQSHDQFPNLLVRLGEAHALRGEWRIARQQFEQAIKLNPGFGPAHRQFAMTLALSEKLDEAVNHFEKAITAEPANIESRIGLANVLIRLRQLDQAQRVLLEALQIQPQHAAANYELAVFWLMRGNVDDAITRYRQAISADAEMASPRRFDRFEQTAKMVIQLLQKKGAAGMRAATQVQRKINSLRGESRAAQKGRATRD